MVQSRIYCGPTKVTIEVYNDEIIDKKFQYNNLEKVFHESVERRGCRQPIDLDEHLRESGYGIVEIEEDD